VDALLQGIKKDVVLFKVVLLAGRFQGYRCTGHHIKFLHLKPDIGKFGLGYHGEFYAAPQSCIASEMIGVTSPMRLSPPQPVCSKMPVRGGFLEVTMPRALMIMLVGSLVLFARSIASSLSGTPEVPQHVLFHVTSSKSEDTPDICISSQHVRPQRLSVVGYW